MKTWIQQNLKLLVFTAFMLIGLLLFASRSNFHTEPPTSPETAENPPPVANTAPEIVRDGVLASTALLPVNSGFAGKILEVYVTNGQPVQAGQALFKLEYATPATPPAGEKSGTVKVDAERLKQLYEQGIISRREWETATGARARTTSNEDGPASAAASPATLVIATTNAPIAGIVSGLTVTAESAVQPDQRILALGSGNKLEAVVSLTQDELYKVPLGARAVIEVAGQSFMGDVSSILPELLDNQVVSFQAHISLANAPAVALQAGMPATVRIQTAP